MSDYKITYGVTKDTKPQESTGGGAIPPGIHDDVTFVGATYGPISETSEINALAFTFEKDGLQVRDTLFEIDAQRIADNFEKYPATASKVSDPEVGLKKGDFPTVEQKIQQAVNRFSSRLMTYFVAFIEDEDARITGNFENFAELAASVVEKMAPYAGINDCRLKVVLNDKDFSTIPTFGSFLERNVPKEKSRLMMGKSDRTERNPAGGAPPPPGGSSTGAPPPPPPGGVSAPAGPPPPPPPPVA